jgi:hypothetical protein
LHTFFVKYTGLTTPMDVNCWKLLNNCMILRGSMTMASHSNIVSCNTIKITTTNMHLKMDRSNGPQRVHKLMPLCSPDRCSRNTNMKFMDHQCTGSIGMPWSNYQNPFSYAVRLLGHHNVHDDSYFGSKSMVKCC